MASIKRPRWPVRRVRGEDGVWAGERTVRRMRTAGRKRRVSQYLCGRDAVSEFLLFSSLRLVSGLQEEILRLQRVKL